MSTELTVKSLFAEADIKKKFKEILGKKSAAFMASVIQIVSQNEALAKCEPMSVFNATAMAAVLDLPVNSQLGFAYILPYRTKATLQLGYKAYIQFAQRTGQFKTISSTPVYEGQIVKEDPLTGFVFDWTAKKSDTIIGFAAYFELISGFQKTFYMTKEQLEKHGSKYSKTYDKAYGMWKKDFEAMASKTVLKLLLSKFAPLSVEIEKAVIVDQSVINDVETLDVDYVDNEESTTTIAAPEEKPVMNQDYEGWAKCRKAVLLGSVTIDALKVDYILSDADAELLQKPDEAPAAEVEEATIVDPQPEKKEPAKTVSEMMPDTSKATPIEQPPAAEEEALPVLNEKHEKWESARNAILGKHTTIESIRTQYIVSDEDALKLEVPPIPK